MLMPSSEGLPRMRTLFAMSFALVLGSCHTPPPERVPSIDDFRGFDTWTRTELPTVDVYPHAIYSNPLADQGPPYALGTAFVRAEETGPIAAWLLHGIVRRGGDFNAGLASGWEFFGIFVDENSEAQLIWRGEHPPLGAGYFVDDTGVADAGPNGLPEGDCNGCHRDPQPIIPYR
jgi:hypothetical protein